MSDALIERLSADLAPVRPRRIGLEFGIIAALVAIEISFLAALGGLRSSWPRGAPMVALWKVFAPLVLAVFASFAALRSGDPARRRVGLIWIGGLAVAVLALGAIAMHPASMATDADFGVQCARFGTLLAIPPALALGLLLRRAAPAYPTRAAIAAAVAGGAWGAAILGMHCAEDSPAHALIWHSLAAMIPAAAAALPIARFSRW